MCFLHHGLSVDDQTETEPERACGVFAHGHAHMEDLEEVHYAAVACVDVEAQRQRFRRRIQLQRCVVDREVDAVAMWAIRSSTLFE